MVARTKLTYAEYAEIAALPENEGRILELIDGEIVEKMPGAIPSEIAGNILFAFKLYLREHPIGYITGEAGGFKMSETNTFNPDVGYISKARRPEKPERENLVPPDFAVEVKSPTDRVRALRRKAEAYLEFGTRRVWLVFPETQTVEVYTPDDDVRTFGINDVLDCGDILPGFTLAVKDIFADL